MQKYVINLIKSAKKSFFISEKMKKYRKCPALPPTQKKKIKYKDNVCAQSVNG